MWIFRVFPGFCFFHSLCGVCAELIPKPSENWQAVLVYDGLSAWYDSVGGMLWSDWLALDESDALPSLEVARARCARHPPAGHWSLVAGR